MASTPSTPSSFEALASQLAPCAAEWTLQLGYREDEEDSLRGFRALHASGFALDLLWASDVPQALLYANTPPDSDRGDAHTCEHLLLGKGARGRAAATLLEVCRVQSTAFTDRLRTVYAFQCPTGVDTFLRTLSTQLAALLAPDATDEEIRREVCSVGPFDAPAGGVGLDEKGTVYNEMQSAFQQPNYCAYHKLHQMLYAWPPADEAEGQPPAPPHPLAFEAGGTPQSIRAARPEHLRAFHNDRYGLSSMGALVVLSPAAAPPAELLSRLGACLAEAGAAERAWMAGAPPRPPPRFPAAQLEEAWLPPPTPAPAGTARLVRVPLAGSGAASGQLVAAWSGCMPPERVSAPGGSLELTLLQMAVHLVCDGQTSELHGALIAAETRSCDLGATSCSGYVCSEPGRAVVVALGGLPPARASTDSALRAAEAMRACFAKLAGEADGGAAVAAFNARAGGYLRTLERSSRKFLAAPPRFGVRGVHDEWLDHLHDARRCAAPAATCIDISFAAEAAQVAALLAQPGAPNIWRELIARWGLAERLPVVVVTLACEALAARIEADKAARLAAFQAGLPGGEEALALFKRAYAEQTAVIDAATAATPQPQPPSDPPLTEDCELHATASVLTLPGGGPLLVAPFLGLSGGHAGLCFSLAGLPQPLLRVLPALAPILRTVGLTSRGGEALDYRQLCARLQREVLYLDPSLTSCRASGRVELVLRAAGLTAAEALAALDWMEALLTAPALDAEALPRARDAVDAAFAAARTYSEQRPEFWQDGLAAQCVRLRRPGPISDAPHRLLPSAGAARMLASCGCAKAHALLRVRWRLRDPPAEAADRAAAFRLLQLLHALPRRRGPARARLEALLGAMASEDGGAAWLAADREADAVASLLAQQLAAPSAARACLMAAANDLRAVLPAVPDCSLRADWRALVSGMAADLRSPAVGVLSDCAQLLRWAATRARARAFLACGPALVQPLTAALRALVARLPVGEPAGAPAPPPFPGVALARASARGARARAHPPPALAMVMPRLAVGGCVSMAACPSEAAPVERWSEDELLDLLAAQTLAGGASHSLFMRGWSSGLAYSSGVSASLADGRLRYYADTCPDVAKTLTAAAAAVAADEQLAPSAWRAHYALAQCFVSRAGQSTPESRAEAAAADDADGRSAPRQRALRSALLRLGAREDLAAQLHARVPRVMARLLPGAAGCEARGWSGQPGEGGATLVVVGAAAQAEGVQALLDAARGAQAAQLLWLYERDLWLCADEPRTLHAWDAERLQGWAAQAAARAAGGVHLPSAALGAAAALAAVAAARLVGR